MKHLLFTGILLSGLSLFAADETLQIQYSEFEKARNYPAMEETAKKILASAVSDNEKINALSRLGSFYMHIIRDRDNGKKYFLEMIKLLRSIAENQTGGTRAGTVERIASLYQTQLRMNAESAAAYSEAVELYRKELPNLSGRVRVEMTGRLRNACRNAKMDAEAAAASKDFLAAWTAFLDENKPLSYPDWRKMVNPDSAIRQLSGSPEERTLAEVITAKILSSPDASVQQKCSALLAMRSSCLAGKDFKTELVYLEKLAALQKESGTIQLQYGEALFRRSHELEQARAVFEKVKSGEYDEKSKRLAALWLDMLAD